MRFCKIPLRYIFFIGTFCCSYWFDYLNGQCEGIIMNPKNMKTLDLEAYTTCFLTTKCVTFEANSNVFTKAGNTYLDSISNILKQHNNLIIQINYYFCSLADEYYPELRSEIIAHELVKQGIPEHRVMAKTLWATIDDFIDIKSSDSLTNSQKQYFDEFDNRIDIIVKEVSNGLKPLNLRRKTPAHFYISEHKMDNDYGYSYDSPYCSRHTPFHQPIPENFGVDTKPQSLQIIAEPDSTVPYNSTTAGHLVYITNTTDSTKYFDCQDRLLYVSRQVYYKGKWRDLDYFWETYCADSYYDVRLGPNHYWKFRVPVYEGNIAAKCRYKLSSDSKGLGVLYSNEFDSWFNLSQLIIKNNPAGT